VCVAFDPEGLGLDVIRAKVRPANMASRAVLAGAGFYDAPTESDAAQEPRYLELEQVNPRAEAWEREWRRYDRTGLPAGDELAQRRAASQHVIAATPVHLCGQAACVRPMGLAA
jgi:RimJ/RimL family protein N-acetyltransferase